jgi:MFS transporter, AAHS family, 3-hydroxyphenylpropionic acid transporter
VSLALVAPLCLTLRPAASRAADDTAPAAATVGGPLDHGRRGITALLWTACFCTSFTLYILLNWLPTFLVSAGYSTAEVMLSALAFNAGGAVGGFAGLLLDRPKRTLWIAAPYLGTALSLVGLASISGDGAVLAASAAVGVFAIGSQFILYGLTPEAYPAPCRGAGVGFAVAIGRIGAVAGPIAAGAALSGGSGTSGVLGAIAPFSAISALVVFLLARRIGQHPAGDTTHGLLDNGSGGIIAPAGRSRVPRRTLSCLPWTRGPS